MYMTSATFIKFRQGMRAPLATKGYSLRET